MTVVPALARIFSEEPLTWGLRGDPYLWRALAEHFAATPWPASAQAFETLLQEAFEHLTGNSVHTQGHFFVAAFAHGGMSSGGVSMNFWREQALPLLRARWAQG